MNTRQLRLEDMKWEETNSRRLTCTKSSHDEMKFMNPVIDFDEFQFTLKIHTCENPGGGFIIGVCDVNHPKKKSGLNCYFGQHGGIGWGWLRGAGVYGPGINNKSLKDKYFNSDLITISVNRPKKTIVFWKNKRSAGKIRNLEFPKDLVIAVSVLYKCDVELIEFHCEPQLILSPLPPLGEEEEQQQQQTTKELMKEMEERFMNEMKIENEKLSEEVKLLKITMERENKRLTEEMKFLNTKSDNQEQEIKKLREEVDSQNHELEEIRKKNKELQVMFDVVSQKSLQKEPEVVEGKGSGFIGKPRKKPPPRPPGGPPRRIQKK